MAHHEYNIDKELGGESPENVKFIGECVATMMKEEGHSRAMSIVHCKRKLADSKQTDKAGMAAVGKEGKQAKFCPHCGEEL